MVIRGRDIPLERSDNPKTDGARFLQPDFTSWLRGIPHDFLQDLFQRYQLEKNNTPRQGVLNPPDPSVSTDSARGSPIADNKNVFAPEILLRHSVFLLVINFLGIELFFDICYILLRFIPVFLSFSSSLQNNLLPIYFIGFMVVNVIKTIFMVFAALQWVTTNYSIKKGEIRYKYGIFGHNEKIFLCNHTQEVVYTQGFLGSVFNFGTIEIYSPVLKEKIRIVSVPNPKKYTEIIKTNLPDTMPVNFFPMDTNQTQK